MSYLKLKWYQITHWEYWPMNLVYYPLFPVWLYFSLKARSFFFFNAANPSIKNGGMAMESKKEIYDLIPSEYIPKTILFEKNVPINDVVAAMENESLNFPLIAKPDIGMKAFAVEKVKNLEQLKNYINKSSKSFLVQEFIAFPKEVGIFYVRMPNEEKGKITGIVSKTFLAVVGDGKQSILQLIKQNPRSYFQLDTLKKKYGTHLNTILPIDEKFILVPYGSHTRGAKFINDTKKSNAAILEVIEAICKQVPGFYYGRLDILCNSLEELGSGENFKIIEINGAGSEPTHIYDPKHSIFYAWYEIIRHWNMLCQVSIANHKKGHKYLCYKDGRAMLRENSKLEEQLKLI